MNIRPISFGDKDTNLNTKNIARTQDNLLTKQDMLISGKNIKTINGNDILGEGDLSTKELPEITGDRQVLITGDDSYSFRGLEAEDLPERIVTGAELGLTALQSFTEVDPTVPEWAKQPEKPTYTPDEVHALSDDTFIPSKLSDLSSDTTHRIVTDEQIVKWTNKSDFSGSYNDLTDKPFIPTVDKNLSAYNNDVGFVTKDYHDVTKQDVIPDLAAIRTGASLGASALQSFTEVDPTVPNWAKQPYKPVYTAQEVGALPSNTKLFSGAYNDLTGKPTIPTKTSQLTNDSDFITTSYHDSTKQNKIDDLEDIRSGAALGKTALQSFTESDPTVPAWAKEATKPSYTAAEVGALPDTVVVPTKTSDLTNDSGFITEHQSLDGYVKDTDYATPATAGVIYSNRSRAFQVTNGWPVSRVFDATEYLSTPTEAFVSKGTLDNVLNAKDYATNSDIPTKTSELTNDSGFITEETDPVYMADKDSLALKTDIPTNGYLVQVEYANTSGADIQAIIDAGNTPYIVSEGNTYYFQDISYDNYYRFVSITPGSNATNDPPIVKRIYKSVGSAANQGWGKGTVQLYSTIHKPTASDIGALPSTTKVPTKLSDLSGDATHRVVTDTEKTTWNNKSDFSGNYNDLSNKPSIPENTSDLTNDSGFISSNGHVDVVETANTETSVGTKYETIQVNMPNNRKMVYGLCTDQTDGTGFIGGLFARTDTTFPYQKGLAIGGSSKNLLYLGKTVLASNTVNKEDGKALAGFSTTNGATTFTKIDLPTKTSDLTNDSNFLTTESDPIYTADKPSIALKSEIPSKVSELENDKNYVSSDSIASDFIEDYWNINGKASGSQTVANCSFYNFKVRPIDKTKAVRVKFRGTVNMPRWTIENLNAQGLAPSSYGNGGEVNGYGYQKAEVDVSFLPKDNTSYNFGITDVWQWNTSYRSLYYWTLGYPITQSQENDWYYFGWSIYSAYQYYTTSSDATFNKLKAVFGRDIYTDILETENCVIEMLEEYIPYAELSTSTHTKTYYQTTTAGRTQTGDANQVDRSLTAMYKNADGPVTGYSICMFTSNGGIGQVFTNTSNSTSATKTFSDRKFDLSRGIWYYAASTARADKYAFAGASFYAVYPTMDLRYTANCSTFQYPNVIGTDLYMVGTIDDDGWFIPSQEEYVYNKVTYKNYIVDESKLPTTADGKVYVLLGHLYSTNKYSMEFVQRHPVYKHNGTRLECIMIL